MIRRIVSGVFLLIALGVLGVIIAGALTSGEQLVVRFLTAIIVAALALYVISDLRLQANDDAAAAGTRATMPTPRITTSDEHPPNSTAAFMATVTGKRSNTRQAISADEFNSNAESIGLVTEQGRPASRSATVPDADRDGEEVTAFAATDLAGSAPSLSADEQAEEMADDTSPYAADIDEASLWPFNDPETAISDDDLAELDDVDGLVAMFTKQSTHERREARTLTMAASSVGSRRTTDFGRLADRMPDLTGTNLGSRPGPALGGHHGPIDDDQAFGTGATDDVDPGHDIEPPTTPDRPVAETADTGTTGTVDIVDSDDNTGTTGTVDFDDTVGTEAPSAPVTKTTDVEDAAPSEGRSTLAPMPSRVVAADYAESGIAPIIDLRTAAAAISGGGIEAAIRSGEYGVIASLIEQGLLSTDGPITDRDVRTMVYVAFTSSELRKILLAGGTIDGDNSDLELGGIDVFAEPADPALPSPSRLEVDLRDVAPNEALPTSQAL